MKKFVEKDSQFYQFFVDAAINDQIVGDILEQYYGRLAGDKQGVISQYLWHVRALRVCVAIRLAGVVKKALVILNLTNKLTEEEIKEVTRLFGMGPQVMRT